MRNLEKPLSELYAFIADAEKMNPAVSSVNVGWHIEHSLLVIIKIIETVCKSNPAQYKWKFSFVRTIVFFQNKFPRGKGNAPDIVKPIQIEETDFDALFAKARQSIEALKNVHPNQFFLHPIFGNLNKNNTFIMLDIHTHHHIHIIRDIIRSL
jgi:hypothetical protein